MTEPRVKFSKKMPPHIREKALQVINGHKDKSICFQKAKNGLYWHYTLPQYYKVVYHKGEDFYHVLSSQDYSKYQKTYC